MINIGFYLNDILAQSQPSTQQVESGFAYVIAAFTVVWLFIAGYLFWLYQRQENLRREVEMLRQEEADRLQLQGSEVRTPVAEDGEYHSAGREEQAPVGRQELGG